MAKTGNEKTNRIRLNDQIRAREVRLVGVGGEQLGVMPTKEAQARAQELTLDLIEVAPMAKPPVCRLGDFGKMRYDQTKKEKQLKKNSSQQATKTVKFKPNIGENDLLRQIATINKFLDKGHRVVVQVRFKGREKKFVQLAQDQVIGRIKEEIPDSKMESPSFQGNQITATFSKVPSK